MANKINSMDLTKEIIERLNILYKKLDDEGLYVSANTVCLALEYIEFHENFHKKQTVPVKTDDVPVLHLYIIVEYDAGFNLVDEHCVYAEDEDDALFEIMKRRDMPKNRFHIKGIVR